VPNVLLIGDTARSPELRHEIPLAIIDPFHYVEIDGRRIAVVWSIEGDRIAAIDPSIEIVHSETFPSDGLIRDGVDLYDIEPILSVRIARALGLREALVPTAFPLQYADALRADGVALTVDQRFFDDRRRRKSPRGLAGIERASRAAEAGMAAVATALARSEPDHGGRSLLEHARGMIRPGVDGTEVYDAVCVLFEERGHPTRSTIPVGEVLREGFNHGLGHGVGLDVHEAPFLGKIGHELVAGDVITLEPGLDRHGFGGVRLEDMVVVTEDRCETITDFPTTLHPALSVVETAR
jgi:Xaa-Pro aminopeptidase